MRYKQSEDDSTNLICCRIIYYDLGLKLDESLLKGHELLGFFRHTAHWLMRHCSPDQLSATYRSNGFLDRLMGTVDHDTTSQKIDEVLKSLRRELDESINENFALHVMRRAISLNRPVGVSPDGLHRLKNLYRLIDILQFRAKTNDCARSTRVIRKRWLDDEEELYRLPMYPGVVVGELRNFLVRELLV